MKNMQQRFLDAEWLEPHEILVVGLGGAGNGIAQNLLAIGHEVHAYDFDEVSLENVYVQGYPKSLIKESKTEAFKTIVDDFLPGSTLEVYNQKYDGLSAQIMISCADSMSARKEVFDSFCASEESELFIDTRMAAEIFEIFTVQKSKPEQIEEYRNYLYLDSEVEEESCTYKATRFNANILHGITTRIVCNYILNKKLEDDVYCVPFHYFWNGFFFTVNANQNSNEQNKQHNNEPSSYTVEA